MGSKTAVSRQEHDPVAGFQAADGGSDAANDTRGLETEGDARLGRGRGHHAGGEEDISEVESDGSRLYLDVIGADGLCTEVIVPAQRFQEARLACLYGACLQGVIRMGCR